MLRKRQYFKMGALLLLKGVVLTGIAVARVINKLVTENPWQVTTIVVVLSLAASLTTIAQFRYETVSAEYQRDSLEIRCQQLELYLGNGGK